MDWNGEIKPGPLELGFDYFFGDPSNRFGAYVENHRVVGVTPEDPIRIERQRIVGGKSAFGVKGEDNAALLHGKALKFIEQHAGHPFYLHYTPNNIHVPLTPNAKFTGTSQAGKYGDFIHELDWSVGEILQTLDRLGLTQNTLVIFTSDNGGVYEEEGFGAGHRSCAPFNGQKGDVWEGGNRVPFLARWPGKIQPGTTSDRLLCLTDLLATYAALTGQKIPEGSARDSFNALPALLGQEQTEGARTSIVLASKAAGIAQPAKDPDDLWAVREANWKLVLGQGAGGSTKDGERHYLSFAEAGMKNSDFTAEGQLKPDAPPGQLYDLATDPGETKNLYREHPEIVERLTKLFEQISESRRSQK